MPCGVIWYHPQIQLMDEIQSHGQWLAASCSLGENCPSRKASLCGPCTALVLPSVEATQQQPFTTGQEIVSCSGMVDWEASSQAAVQPWSDGPTGIMADKQHWLPVQQRIAYKLSVLTYKVRNTSTLVYLYRRITEHVCSRILRSSAILCWSNGSLGQTCFLIFSIFCLELAATSSSHSLSVFKSRLKTFLFNQAFIEHWSDLPPAPLKLWPYGAIEIRLLLLYYYWFNGCGISSAC